MLYSELASVYEKLEATAKRLEKKEIIADFLKKASESDLENIMYLLQGKVFPVTDERKIGMSSQTIIKSIALATGNNAEKVTKLWKKIGDLGLVAEQMISAKKQRTLYSKKLDVKKVFDNIKQMPELIGKGTVSKKINLASELLTSASPLEARYIVRTILEAMRIGVAEGTLREAIATAYGADVKEVEHAYSMLVDYVEVAKLAKKHNLKKAELVPGRAFEPMLAIKAETFEEAFEALGKPAQFEYKIDGFRLEIHKTNGKISLFTRRMENVTKQFPEIIQVIEKHVHASSFIIDSELVGYDSKSKKYLPFQSISQRIKRKYDIVKISKDFPVEIDSFDILYLNGKNLMHKPFSERRKILEKVVKQERTKIIVIPKLVTDNVKEAEKFYKESLKAGNEGVMIKKLDNIYVPGRHVGGWLKFKPVMETLDLVIVGAEWGEGKRATWLSSFDLACRHENKFLLIGKVGTGIKEKEKEGVTFDQLTKELKPYIEKEDKKHVTIKPKLVVEVAYEEIQKSPTYNSGWALRFPRILRIRYDRSPANAETLERIKGLAEKQRGRNK